MNNTIPFPKKTQPPLAWKPPAELARDLAKQFPLVRVPTGIGALDTAFRGGIPVPRTVILGGAPGAGKTSFATWLAWSWARLQGIHVAFLAVDEGTEGILMRLAQLEGFDINRLEGGDRDELENFARRLEGLPITIVDGDDERGTVENVTAHLREVAGDEKAAFVCDSIQTVRAFGSDKAENPRARVDCIVNALKLSTRKHRLITLATCELSRSAYRYLQVAEQLNDLAAFKESGGIEYGAQTCLVMRSVPNGDGLIDVGVPKNRAYRKVPFRLEMSHRTTAFKEVALPPPETQKSKKGGGHLEEDMKVVCDILRKFPGIGTRELRIKVKNQHNIGSDRVDCAKHELCTNGLVVNKGTKNVVQLFVEEITTTEESD